MQCLSEYLVNGSPTLVIKLHIMGKNLVSFLFLKTTQINGAATAICMLDAQSQFPSFWTFKVLHEVL